MALREQGVELGPTRWEETKDSERSLSVLWGPKEPGGKDVELAEVMIGP